MDWYQHEINEIERIIYEIEVDDTIKDKRNAIKQALQERISRYEALVKKLRNWR